MIIGTAGHIDHGKTSLVHALTGVDTDRLKEEKARGISIDLGFAYLPAPDGSIVGFVDVPGHERFVRNMVAGATGVDFVLLVVAADDGPMPQTFEHLAIVDLLGAKRGVVALTKADLAAAAGREEAERAIRRTLAGTTLAGAEIIPVSTITGEGIDALREHVFDAARHTDRHSARGRFRLAVDRSFSLPGIGAVVTGTVLSGSVEVGNRVTISPRGIDPSLHAPTDRIDATLRVLVGEKKPIGQWTPVRLHHAAAEVGAHVVLFADQPVEPGSEAFVQLVLERTIAAAVGDRFILRHPSGQRTIGGGRFLDLCPPARKRRTPERLGQLAACALEDPAESLATLLARAPYFIDFSAFTRDRALADGESEQLARKLALVQIATPVGLIVVSELTSKRVDENVLAALAAFHADNPDLPGLGMEQLRLQLVPRLPVPAFAARLRGLAQAQAVALDGAWVRLPHHSVKLTSGDERAWARVWPLLAGDCRFRPPRVRDVAALLSVSETDVRRLMKLTARIGKVDEIAHDHFFLRETVAEMAAIMLDLANAAAEGQFTAAEFRDRLDNGRKVAIQVLEFFDRHGVTLRRGDRRRMNKHRLDLFRTCTEADHSPSGREASPVGRPDFKSGRGREPVSGGFDSHSLPP
jgi:selenocysteine-specific elongation factor